MTNDRKQRILEKLALRTPPPGSVEDVYHAAKPKGGAKPTTKEDYEAARAAGGGGFPGPGVYGRGVGLKKHRSDAIVSEARRLKTEEKGEKGGGYHDIQKKRSIPVTQTSSAATSTARVDRRIADADYADVVAEPARLAKIKKRKDKFEAKFRRDKEDPSSKRTFHDWTKGTWKGNNPIPPRRLERHENVSGSERRLAAKVHGQSIAPKKRKAIIQRVAMQNRQHSAARRGRSAYADTSRQQTVPVTQSRVRE